MRPDILEYMTAEGFVIPEMVDGKPTWVPFAGDIQERMRKGDPTVGWEGDERLYIAPRDERDGGGYVVGRLNEDGSKSLVCWSEPPHALDTSLLVFLAEHDTRHVDVYGRVEKKNAALRKEQDTQTKERIAEAYERAVHGIVKDVGHLY